MYPTDRRYTKEHEWVRVEDGRGTVGITQFAQGELGDIVFVELPEKGRSVKRGEVLGTIESVKAVSEIYAPLSGVVEAVNSLLEDRPEAVNEDPHGEGWLVTISVGDESELADLLDADAYKELAGG
jgi:glycine cleavage system H protein